MKAKLLSGIATAAMLVTPALAQQYPPSQPYQAPSQDYSVSPNDIVPIARSGYWEADQVTSGQGACVASTYFSRGGTAGMFMIGVNGIYQSLNFSVGKGNWRIPPNARVQVTLQIDRNPPITTSPTNSNDGTSMMWTVDSNFEREFIHEITSGSMLIVRFQGNELPWSINLYGTTGIWPAFMRCADSIAPNFVASINPSQPYNAPSQPYAGTPSSQPYVQRSQPYNPPLTPYALPPQPQIGAPVAPHGSYNTL